MPQTSVKFMAKRLKNDYGIAVSGQALKLVMTDPERVFKRKYKKTVC